MRASWGQSNEAADSKLLRRVVASKDVAGLLVVLKDLAGIWELFIMQLVPDSQGKVDAIRFNRSGQPNSASLCLSDGLQHFVNSSEEPTYGDIIAVLRGDAVKKIPIANKLEEYLMDKYGGPKKGGVRTVRQRTGRRNENIQPLPSEQQQSRQRETRCQGRVLYGLVALLLVTGSAVLCWGYGGAPTETQDPNSLILLHTNCTAQLEMKVASSRPSSADFIFINWRNTSDGSVRVFRLRDSILSGCKDLGATFGLSPQVLKAVCRKGHEPSDCCDEVLRRWTEGSIDNRQLYPNSWAGFIRALRDANLHQAASDLECALVNREE